MAKTDARQRGADQGMLALQPASQDIWDSKYRLKHKSGKPIDGSVDETWQRVARALADVEANKALREVGHPDAERLTGVGLRLQTAVDALDQWANGSNQEAGQ